MSKNLMVDESEISLKADEPMEFLPLLPCPWLVGKTIIDSINNSGIFTWKLKLSVLSSNLGVFPYRHFHVCSSLNLF